MKRFISLLLCALILLSSFSFASFAEEDEWSLPFTDVKESAWYYEDIEFCYLMGVVSGMTETTFKPNGTLTRAQFVQILAMVDGVDLTEYKDEDSGFADVKSKHWFNAPVCWAVEHGIVAGLSADRFGPNETITREQLARLLYLYAEYCGCDVSRLADLSGYTDKPSDWAYEQVQWAVGAGIISGMDQSTLAPRASATRAQACRMIMSFYDFIWYGYRDTSGAFRVIADYIMENGEDSSHYILSEEHDGYYFIFEYYPNDDMMYIIYCTEPYEFEEQGIVYTGYREMGCLDTYSLASSYSFTYYYDKNNDTDYMYTSGYMDIDSYTEDWNESYGFTSEDFTLYTENAMTHIRERIAAILAEADMTLQDFFIPEQEKPGGATFDILADYISKQGEEIIAGGYQYKMIIDDALYTAQYDAEADTILLCREAQPYVSEEYGEVYAEGMTLYIDGIYSEYELAYYYSNENTLEYILASVTIGNSEPLYQENKVQGLDSSRAREMACNAAKQLEAFAELLLVGAGLDAENFYN